MNCGGTNRMNFKEVSNRDFHETVCWYALGQVLADDLPDIAVRALENGHDSESLRQLAGKQGADTTQLQELFSRTLEEIGISMPSPEVAGLEVARRIAVRVLAGDIQPYAGARLIWKEVYWRSSEPEKLRIFVGLASEYEDDEKHRSNYERHIVQACKEFVGV